MQRREKLAALLTKLIDETYNESLRLEAARLAVQIALQEGDPTAADITDSLVAGSPSGTHANTLGDLRHIAATARAARRAIAMTAPLSATSPREQILSGTDGPEQVRREVQARILGGQLQLACSIVRIGLTRHPDDQGLHEIAAELDKRLAESKLPAPIYLVLDSPDRPTGTP